MNFYNLINIIRENIQQQNVDKLLSDKIRSDIKYLNNFELVGHKESNNIKGWFYKHKPKDYIIKLYVFDASGIWSAKLQVFWKNETDGFTHGKGKDVEKQFGPFKNYDELIKELNLKLNNNLLFSPELFHDDTDLNKDKEIILLLKKLKGVGEKLATINDEYFNDIKNVYNDIINMDDGHLLNYCQKKAPKEEDKQAMILYLQKMNKLDFYNSMNGMHR